MAVLLNIDLGELPGEPDELYALASIANIACGGHAGDDASMERAVALALRGAARISAHPSFPDRERFGRVRMDLAPDALYCAIVLQCGQLRAAAERAGARVEYVKPHGALYHEAARDPAEAQVVLDAAIAVLGSEIAIIGPPLGALERGARARKLRYTREGFADRRYVEGATGSRRTGEEEAFRAGRLAPRSEAGAMIDDPTACAAQTERLVASGVIDTVCVHGDGPRAVEVARAVRSALDRLGSVAADGASVNTRERR